MSKTVYPTCPSCWAPVYVGLEDNHPSYEPFPDDRGRTWHICCVQRELGRLEKPFHAKMMKENHRDEDQA